MRFEEFERIGRIARMSEAEVQDLAIAVRALAPEELHKGHPIPEEPEIDEALAARLNHELEMSRRLGGPAWETSGPGWPD